MPAVLDVWNEPPAWSLSVSAESGTYPVEDGLGPMVMLRSERHGEGAGGPSDEDLMEAFVGGHAEAFEILVHRHGRALYSFLLRSVNNHARAEELLQEVFLRVIRSKARYRRSAKFSTWMFTIARNLCVDESRRARFRDHESLDAPRRGRPEGEGRTLLSALRSNALPTDTAADAPLLRARLAQAVNRLPSDQREVFLMRQMAGLSFREIGDAVGAPENTVKSRMRYALDKLRQELADVYIGEPIPPEAEEDESRPYG